MLRRISSSNFHFMRNIKSLSQKYYAFAQTISLSGVFSLAGLSKSIPQYLPAEYYKKWSIARKPHVLTIMLAVVIFCSCQKEDLNNTVTNSTAQSDASTASAALKLA